MQHLQDLAYDWQLLIVIVATVTLYLSLAEGTAWLIRALVRIIFGPRR